MYLGASVFLKRTSDWSVDIESVAVRSVSPENVSIRLKRGRLVHKFTVDIYTCIISTPNLP